jgi:hypothetical protein
MPTFYLAAPEEEPLIPVECPAGAWLILDMYNFALRIFSKASGGLYRSPLVTDKHKQLTACITGFGDQKWDPDHNLKKKAEIMSLRRSFAAWMRIPIYDFQSGSFFWRSTQRCMDHYHYGRQNRTRLKKLPRSLLERTPEDIVASKKRRTKAAVGATPKRSRTRLDILTTPAIWHREVDSDDNMEALALANTVVPESAMSDMCGEAAGERYVPPDPRSAHPASCSNIPVSSHSQSVNLLADEHNMVSVQSKKQAAEISTNPTTSVSLPSNQNLLVDYLREFNAEKDKAICKMSKTQLKLFDLISIGKCVNGVPYFDPTQFLSAIC